MLQNLRENYFQPKITYPQTINQLSGENQDTRRQAKSQSIHHSHTLFQEATNLGASPKGRSKPTKRKMGSRK